MILTGKCEQDFKKHISWRLEYLSTDCLSDETTLQALITEWFDSVDIFIEIRRANNSPLSKGFHGYVIKSINGYYRCTTIPCKTRQEATEEAIKQANEKYNERFK